MGQDGAAGAAHLAAHAAPRIGPTQNSPEESKRCCSTSSLPTVHDNNPAVPRRGFAVGSSVKILTKTSPIETAPVLTAVNPRTRIWGGLTVPSTVAALPM